MYELDKTERYLRSGEGKTCPWCDELPTIMPWHGGAPTKKLINCVNEECVVGPAVSGDTEQEALDNWNTRQS